MKPSTTPPDADTSDILKAVDAALANLGEKDRAVIAMRYLQQRPLREIAEALGVNEEAAKKRVSRAVERLRGRLVPLRREITLTGLAIALEQAASFTAPPALAAKVATAAVSTSASASTGGLMLHLLTTWKIGIAIALVLSFTGLAVWLLQNPSPASKPIAINPAPLIVTAAPANVVPMPAVASLSAQQRRVYELIYKLRNSIPPQRPEEWITTLREITQIGAPAVPALCVELDHTEKDKNQRLLIVALRIIGDARAVPSLIRAIPRVAQESSDYGVEVADPDLRQFLNSHFWMGAGKADPRMCFFNRGITECIAALEAITHHSEGHAPIMDMPGSISPRALQQQMMHPPTTQQLADQQARLQKSLLQQMKRRELFAGRWQKWWADHQTEFKVDMSTVDAVRYNGDLVLAVGSVMNAAFFPTGPLIHLTAVRECDVQVQGLWDARAFLNLSTGRLLCLNEDRHDHNDENVSLWYIDAGIDVFASVMGDKDAGGNHWFVTLDSSDMKSWPIDNARFDTIENEVHAGQPLNLGGLGPCSGLEPRDLKTGEEHFAQYPATFLFQTRNNRFGILQIVKGVNGQTTVRIRYRLWPESAFVSRPGSEPVESSKHTLPAGSKFGVIHQVTLGLPNSDQPAALNLKTGQTQAQKVDVDNPGWTEAKIDWATQSAVDLCTILSQNKTLVGLCAPTTRLVVAGVSDSAWDQMSVETCAAIAGRAKAYPSQSNFMIPGKDLAPGDGSSTWIVCAPGAGDLSGIVQITHVQPTSLTLRYKLIESPASK